MVVLRYMACGELKSGLFSTVRPRQKSLVSVAVLMIELTACSRIPSLISNGKVVMVVHVVLRAMGNDESCKYRRSKGWL